MRRELHRKTARCFLLFHLALCVGLAVPADSQQLSDSYCGCIDLDSTVDALRRVTNVDWTELEEGDVARVWPQARPIPCESSSLTGVGAVAQGIERCCASCGTCGGPYFGPEGGSTQGLQYISVGVCRGSRARALSDLKRLVDAVVPDQRDASYEEGWATSESEGGTHNEYRWTSSGTTFNVRAFVATWEDSIYGSFELAQCDRVNELEEWVFEGGTQLSVTEVDVRTTSDGERQFWFAYETRCVIADYECLKAEWRVLWPRLRLLAERENTTTVFLSSEACTFGGMTVYPKRNSLGGWELPW